MRHVLVLAFFTVAATMTFAQSSKQVFPNANASLPFSTAIKADGLIYVSGTLGSGGDVKAQTKQVLDNISAAAQGGRLESRERRQHDGVSQEPERLRGDERGVSHLLDQGSTGAHHRDGAAPQRGAGGDLGRRGT